METTKSHPRPVAQPLTGPIIGDGVCVPMCVCALPYCMLHVCTGARVSALESMGVMRLPAPLKGPARCRNNHLTDAFQQSHFSPSSRKEARPSSLADFLGRLAYFFWPLFSRKLATKCAFSGIWPFALSGEIRSPSASLRSTCSDRPSGSEQSLSFSRKLKTAFRSGAKTNRGLNVLLPGDL